MKDAPKPPSVEDVSEMIRTAFQNAGSNPGGSNLEAGLKQFGWKNKANLIMPVEQVTQLAPRCALCGQRMIAEFDRMVYICPNDDYELSYEVVSDFYR